MIDTRVLLESDHAGLSPLDDPSHRHNAADPMLDLEALWRDRPAGRRVEFRVGDCLQADRRLRAFAAASGAALLRGGVAEGSAVLASSAAEIDTLIALGWRLVAPARDLDDGLLNRRSRLLVQAGTIERLPARVAGDGREQCDVALRHLAQTQQSGHVYLHAYRDVTVLGSMTLADDEGLVEAGRAASEALDAAAASAAAVAHPLGRLEDAALISLGTETNYWHWMTESLLSALLMRTDEPEGRLRLVGHDLADYELQAMDLLGLPDMEYVGLKPWQKLQIGRLRTTSALWGTLTVRPPRQLLAMYDRMLGAAMRLEPVRPPHRWLYISRRDSSKRKLTDEVAIEQALAARGFEIVVLTGMSVAAQARLFAEAEVVVGPHGAGLTNLGFCRPGTRVLEIHASHYINSCMFRIGELASLDMYLYVGTTHGTSTERHQRGYSVNVTHLVRCCTQLATLGEVRQRMWAGPGRM